MVLTAEPGMSSYERLRILASWNAGTAHRPGCGASVYGGNRGLTARPYAVGRPELVRHVQRQPGLADSVSATSRDCDSAC